MNESVRTLGMDENVISLFFKSENAHIQSIKAGIWIHFFVSWNNSLLHLFEVGIPF